MPGAARGPVSDMTAKLEWRDSLIKGTLNILRRRKSFAIVYYQVRHDYRCHHRVKPTDESR